MSSAPIPTDGHRSKSAAIVYGVLAQAGPMHDLALDEATRLIDGINRKANEDAAAAALTALEADAPF